MEATVATEAAMEALGRRLAAVCASGIIFLRGELGAGKTTLVRGFLRHLGQQTTVKSPTFTLIEAYSLNGREIYHLDLYRLIDPAEFDYLGADDYLRAGATWLVEWPEHGQGHLPAADLDIQINYAGSGRQVKIAPLSRLGKEVLANLQN